ncbi:MAG: 4a-hydroxytetrahydrobiopterin dehydratase [Candidatus Methylomirabilia bacterium]
MGKQTAEQYLARLSRRWTLIDGKRIRRDFTFEDFALALAFVNRVGAIADEEGHHPDILIHSWNQVRLEIMTHAVGGLSENDFILAAKIDRDAAQG